MHNKCFCLTIHYCLLSCYYEIRNVKCIGLIVGKYKSDQKEFYCGRTRPTTTSKHKKKTNFSAQKEKRGGEILFR